MLYLISIGLSDEKDMSLRAVEAAKGCDKLYAELFTTRMATGIPNLEALIGKKIIEASRKDMEEGSAKIIHEAKQKDVGILVGGDALAATTHMALLAEARKAGIQTRVVHGSSIFTAIAETGLFLYKFGRAVTLPYRQKNYRPVEFYDFVLLNKKNGMHSLILLDVQPARAMDAHEALGILLETEKEKGSGLFTENTHVVAACCLGTGKNVIKYGSVKNLLSDPGLKGKTPAVIILPSGLNFAEKEYLDSL